LGVIVAALLTSLGTVIAAWLQNRPQARAGVLETAQNESGGRAQPLTPTPSTMGREFDRHHLPRWRPEPPFLPGRITEPARPRAPGAAYPSSNSPKREPSKEKYKELLAVLAVGRLRSRHWSGAELLGVNLATIHEAATNLEPYIRADGTRI
jgi:hypothetical protein